MTSNEQIQHALRPVSHEDHSYDENFGELEEDAFGDPVTGLGPDDHLAESAEEALGEVAPRKHTGEKQGVVDPRHPLSDVAAQHTNAQDHYGPGEKHPIVGTLDRVVYPGMSISGHTSSGGHSYVHVASGQSDGTSVASYPATPMEVIPGATPNRGGGSHSSTFPSEARHNRWSSDRDSSSWTQGVMIGPSKTASKAAVGSVSTHAAYAADSNVDVVGLAQTAAEHSGRGVATHGLMIGQQFSAMRDKELVADPTRSDMGTALSAMVSKHLPFTKNDSGKYLTDERPEDIEQLGKLRGDDQPRAGTEKVGVLSESRAQEGAANRAKILADNAPKSDGPKKLELFGEEPAGGKSHTPRPLR